jgi:hypothetical protein
MLLVEESYNVVRCHYCATTQRRKFTLLPNSSAYLRCVRLYFAAAAAAAAAASTAVAAAAASATVVLFTTAAAVLRCCSYYRCYCVSAQRHQVRHNTPSPAVVCPIQ